MAVRITLERFLRDDDDASGQSVRDWKLESEPGFVVIKLKQGDGSLLLRTGDIPQFVQDLHRARTTALDLAKENA